MIGGGGSAGLVGAGDIILVAVPSFGSLRKCKTAKTPNAPMNNPRHKKMALPLIAFAFSPILYPFVGDWRYDGGEMRPTNPPPQVPGDTEAERMKNALRMMFSVPKEAYLREEARLKRARDRKRARKQPA